MKPRKEGDRVPQTTFRTRQDNQWKDVTSDEIFSGRTVVLFALPGAFTPTCSSTHLPRYEQQADAFAAAGVDEIVCLSVNDAFVMEEWGRAQGADRVRLLPDGSAEFTRAMGMAVQKDNLGFGPRSWRYSMLVRDGVIEKMFVEPGMGDDAEGDPFEVSDADTLLRWLAPHAVIPESVAVFTRPGCPHCARATAALRGAGIRYEEIELGRDITTAGLEAVAGRATSPQIFMGGRHIGGADDLEAWLADRAA